MKAVAVPVSSLRPSPDNPSGRWDAQYLHLIGQLKEGEPQDTWHAYKEWMIRERLGMSRWRALEAKIHRAVNAAELFDALRGPLGIGVGTPELVAGLKRLATYLIQQEVNRLSAELAAGKERLEQLNA